MPKLMTASLLVIILFALQTNAFAGTLNCKFKGDAVPGVESIKLSEESLFINTDLEIPLEESKVNCGHFGRQTRLDGMALGYQVILKSCTSDAKLEGHIIDSVKEEIAEVLCD